MMVNVGGTSQPPIGDAVQQSSEPVYGQQSSSQPPVLLTTTQAHTTITTATTSSAGTPLPRDIIMIQAGCWTRFLLFLGCVSAENEDDHQ
jgi:hypothetical protein